MKIKLPGLTAEYTYDDSQLLCDWEWMIGKAPSILCVTKFGEIMIQKSDGIYFLSTVYFTFEKVAVDVHELQKLAKIRENYDNWFMPEAVNFHRKKGQDPKVNECLSPKTPLILGGEFEPDNIEVSDLMVHLSISGQIYQQTKDLPPGTEIGDIHIK